MVSKEPIKVLDHGFVRYVDHMGSEESIIEAARMSTGKGFEGWGPIGCENCLGEGVPATGAADHRVCQRCKGKGEVPGDEKLLAYLWKNGHHTPFEMVTLVVEAQAPIFVLRQWHRHRVPFSYNEHSARYSEMPDLFFEPALERVRKAGKVNKQGSGEPVDEIPARRFLVGVHAGTETARGRYKAALESGVAPELARIGLPLNQYTRHRVSSNLRGWLAFLTLRQHEHAQEEIRVYGDAIARIVAELWPRTWALYEEHTRYAVTFSRSELAELREYIRRDKAMLPGLARKVFG